MIFQVIMAVVIKDFWAAWCGPCRTQAPLLEEFEKEHPEVKVEKINVDEDRETAIKYGVTSIPTIIVEKDGEIIKRFVGVTYPDELEKVIN